MRKSKKWFESFPKDKLKEICDHLEITPENFYKAAILDDSGKVYVDYLKCERPIPKEWDTHYEWVSNNIGTDDFNFYEHDLSVEDTIQVVAKLYGSFIGKELKLKKFQDTAYVRARTISLCNTFKRYFKTYDIQETDVKKFISQNVTTHLKMYLDDINILYKKS